MVTRLIPGVRANGVTLTLLTSAVWRTCCTITTSRSGQGAIKCPVFDCESVRTKGVGSYPGGEEGACLLEEAGHCPPNVDM